MVSGEALSTGRMTLRSIATPPTNAIASVSTNAGQYGLWLLSDHAMKVVNIAISPCAKLTTSRRPVDEDEREREAGVDGAEREAADDLLEELVHVHQ